MKSVSLASWGKLLVHRQVAGNILKTVTATNDDDDDVWLDFAGVSVVNAEFADALFSGLQARRLQRPNAFFGLKHVAPSIHLDLHRALDWERYVLKRENHGLTTYADGKYGLIGHLQPTCRAAWVAVVKGVTVTAKEWRERDGRKMAVPAYSTYLKDAFDAGLVARSNDRGKGYAYWIPSAEEGI